MPRKPNYKFERMERDRAKAAKKAARAKAKEENREGTDPEALDSTVADAPDVEDLTTKENNGV